MRGLLILVAAAITGSVVTMILLPQPQLGWNSGARERLAEALKTIGQELLRGDERGAGNRLDPQDFIAENTEQRLGLTRPRGEVLVKRHGVRLSWRKDGRYEDVLFYPIAFSNSVTIEPNASAAPVPQIVMVPLDDVDVEAVPTLYGCGNTNADEEGECQLRRMKELFLQQGIGDAAVLMSNGSVLHIQVDKLFDGV